MGTFLYAADFRNGKIDVLNSAFAKTTIPGGPSQPFVDPNLPKGYAPYNVQVLNGKLYVLYAKVDPATGKASPGPNQGFGNVFNFDGSPGLPNGNMRLISGINLNAPWGAAIAPSSFGPFGGTLLIGNNGDGTIDVFDPTTGAFLGMLLDPMGNPITNSGLWALRVGNGGKTAATPTHCFLLLGSMKSATVCLAKSKSHRVASPAPSPVRDCRV